MSRSTVKVTDALEIANTYLASKESTVDGREATCSMIEALLFAANNYGGYRYLDTSEVLGNGTRRMYVSKK